MISTYLGYQLYGQNLGQTLKQTAASPAVSQAEQYYNANIGNVKTVSDLVNNYRLLSYVTQAFGLGSMTYAKGLITQVLESNLSDSSSVANKLGGNYVALAKAFNFSTTGTLNSTTQLQTSTQEANTEATFSATTSQSSSASSTTTTNYSSAISSVTTLQGLESNSTTLDYALSAYGVSSSSTSSASSIVSQTLESNLASSTSYVNEQADSGYLALWQGFTVNSDGSAASVQQAESQTNIQATTQAYLSQVGTAAASQANGASATSYFVSQIGSITSASQLVADSKLVSYLTTAYQLPSSTTATDIEDALTSNTSDSSSYANSSPYAGFLKMAKAFNFGTSGTAGTVTQFQSANQQQSTVNLYMEHQSTDSTAADTATAYYKANIGSITSVSQLESNSQLLKYVETAYGLSSSTSNSTLQSILENTNGIATTSPNAGLLALNQAYNINSNGDTTGSYTAQSTANVSATTSAYFTNAAGTTAADVTASKAATGYYETAIANVSSVDNLLSDPKLVAYLEQAYEIPTSTTTATLKQVLTSNLSDASSVANTMGNNYAQLAASFNFSTNGLITKESGTVQTRAQLSAVNNGYLDQQIETNAGNQNPGISLALYFQFQAPNITSAYSILADSKLVTVFQTMMGESSSASNANIDVQAAQISSQFDLSKLKDPTYLKSLIQRFSVMYDINPPTSTGTYTATSVLTGSTSNSPLDVTALFSSSKKSTAQLLFGASSTNSTSTTSSANSSTAEDSTSVLFG
ncbi:MAG: DUF1217 domain-containing protein [Beijerinckiaceae bacterium]|nr:DUF1217 domain-containing protein [Beijerinckiaceae bacterium]